MQTIKLHPSVHFNALCVVFSHVDLFIFLARSYIYRVNQSPTCSNKILATITLKIENKNQTTNFLILKTCNIHKGI